MIRDGWAVAALWTATSPDPNRRCQDLVGSDPARGRPAWATERRAVTRAVSCLTCGTSWSSRGARFCGTCGSSLVAASDPGGPEPRRRRWRTPGPAVLAALVATPLLLVTVVAVGLRPTPDDPEVALPDRGTVPAGSRLSDDEAAVLRSQVDPTRLRCEPRGCEVWRRQNPDGFTQAIQHGDLLVLHEGAVLVGLDVDTGTERWTTRLDDLWAVTGDGDAIDSPEGTGQIPLLAVSDEGIVFLTDRAVVLLDLDGERRWRSSNPGLAVWNIALTQDRVLLGGVPREEARLQSAELMVALDRSNGSVRWERSVLGHVGALSPSVVLVGDGRMLRGLDPSDGSVRWERRLEPGEWGGELVGPWVAITFERDQSQVLLDPLTGEEVGRLPGFLIHPPVPVDGGMVALVSEPEGSGDRGGRVALRSHDASGQFAWEVPVGTSRWGCCPHLAEADGVVSARVGGELLRIDAATGDILDRTELSPSEEEVLLAGDGTAVRWTQGGLSLRGDGMGARAFARDLWLVSGYQPGGESWVVGGVDGQLLGLRLVPDS
jgi:outer membrane protein assembly factor BamB